MYRYLWLLLLWGSSLFCLTACHLQTETDLELHQVTTLDQLRLTVTPIDRSESWQYIPRTGIERLVPALSNLQDVREKKVLFFAALLPMVLLVNEEVLNDRAEVSRLRTAFFCNRALTEADINLLERLCSHYRISVEDGEELFSLDVLELLRLRVDEIPVELALAQAANESGWGGSRFALEGNNLFGEWTFEPGTGIVPEGRPEGALYEVKKFPNLLESVRSYARNLNTHQAYRAFREMRADMRYRKTALSGRRLATTLIYYSTRRHAYVKELRSIIRSNDLTRFRRVYLAY